MGYTAIDLFAGAGGLAEGFRQAGFKCLYANDFDEDAINTFEYNHDQAIADSSPIESINTAVIRKSLRLEVGELDTLVGGPPCQGFSINRHQRFIDDPRNSLFKHYMRFVDEFVPKTIVFENVPGMISLAEGEVYRSVLNELISRGYVIQTKVLFSAHYGVPQERWRLIILGTKRTTPLVHPYPTHYATGRANFRGGRTMTIQLTELEEPVLKPAVTIGDALQDLPKLRPGEGAEEVCYNGASPSTYALSLRTDTSITYNHYAAKLSSINMERLKHIPPGGSWRDIPYDLLPRGMKKARRSDHTKRYGRLRWTGLAGTVLTKCDPHWGAVFLPDQDRALTVREAARIQSFPDHYRFLGSRTSQYKQVGNAVPVLMAKAIALQVHSHIAESTS